MLFHIAVPRMEGAPRPWRFDRKVEEARLMIRVFTRLRVARGIAAEMDELGGTELLSVTLLLLLIKKVYSTSANDSTYHCLCFES